MDTNALTDDRGSGIRACAPGVERVFIGGSRAITRLDAQVRSALEDIVRNAHCVLVGDCYGVDRAVQQHLANLRAERVVVYAVDGNLRNCLGPWPVRLVTPPVGARGFDLFSSKDRAMGKEATRGFMLWDGKSRGTLANVRDMVAQGKPVAVTVGYGGRTVVVRSREDLRALVAASGS